MKKILIAFFLMMVLMPSACADMGPKPSVSITFSGINDAVFYVALLAENRCILTKGVDDTGVWEKFKTYEDEDGLIFTETLMKNQDNNQYSWNYLPPDLFKILVYFPESDSFVVSDIQERYAFESGYQVTFRDNELIVREQHDLLWQFFAFTSRVLGTIVVEVAIGFLFGFQSTKAMEIIIKTNLFTQVVLNVVLHFSYQFGGIVVLILLYFFLEFWVFLLEALAYKKYFFRHQISGWPVIYAFVANVASFFAGIGISILNL